MPNKKITIVLAVSISIIVIVGGSVGIYFLTQNKPVQLYIAIHCEPGALPSTTDYPAQYWDDLVTMVFKADQSNVKLNIMFNPQWGIYILQNISRLQLVRSWEINGHEIALHFHGPNHGSWCGYTNQIEYQADPKYIGTVEDMMNILNQLPASGEITTGCVGTEEDIIYDCPEEIIYTSYGASEKIDHLWSNPFKETYNNHEVMRVSHSRFATPASDVNIDFEEFKELYKAKNNERIMGLVWHAFDYADDAPVYDQLFVYLAEQLIQTYRLPELLG